MKIVLLTGAGSSKGFGGFLSPEVYALLYPRIRARIPSSSDVFGTWKAYGQVNGSGNFETFIGFIRSSANLVSPAMEALIEVFSIQENALDITRAVLLKCFLSHVAEAGQVWWYTLNQDMLVERLMESGGLPILIEDAPDGVEVLPVPARVEGEPLATYRRLHGCMNWRDKQGFPVFVTGDPATKSHQLGSLAAIHSGFIDDLRDADTVVVIGYSFGDPHINRCFEGLNEKARVIVISPSAAADIRQAATLPGNFVESLRLVLHLPFLDCIGPSENQIGGPICDELLRAIRG